MNGNPVRNGLGLGVAVLPLAFAIYGCNQQTVEAKLRSLQASSEVTFVCRGIDSGLPREKCPDVDNTPEQNLLDALVTQTATDEIAIVDVSHALVVDADTTIPGYNFLRLPSRPGDIVTTPGGTASFVGLTTTGRTGISVIPTDCVAAPKVASIAQGIPQSQRDVTTFPACRLPSAPGELAVLVEPPAADGTIAESCADPTTPESKEPPGGTRYSVVPAASAEECTATAGPGEYPFHGVWVATTDGGFECRLPNGRDCAANLTTEGGPSGRRKLLVALPDEGRLVVLDAQAILDREPGSFDPCEIDREIVLSSAPDASGQKQKPPPDLATTCKVPEPPASSPPPNARSRPAGFGVSDGRLFVGDLGVPLVHVLDTSSVCGARELPSLLPMSYVEPWRVVTTSRVGVTPVTPAGKQFVYAVDSNDQPTSSVMMFDVSDGVTDRTPIVRPGWPKQPREAADRLQFPAPVADLTFALRDLADSDPATGVAELGTECDPDPALPLNPPPPEVQYRSNADHTQGARPRLLRGLFGLVLLTNGQVYVVDVDDFDHKCRRPIGANASSTPDFRGCANDPADVAFYTYKLDADGNPVPDGTDGTRTVTDEVSCNMVQPHRTRSALFGLSDATLGIGAPALRALPRFEAPRSTTQVQVNERPKLLAVPFASPDGGEGVPPEVYVGTSLYREGHTGTDLPTAPNPDEEENGITLPPSEPRSYLAADHNLLVYEGRVGPDYQSGFFDLSGLGLDPGQNGVLSDPAAFYCGNAVYDEAAMATYARDVLGLSDKAAQDFAEGSDDDPDKGHADYVQITGDFPALTDPYWQSVRGLAGGGREQCLEIFGPPPGQSEDLETNRDFRVIEAYQDHLVIRPRRPPRVTADPSRFEDGSDEQKEEQRKLEDQQAAHDAFPDKIRAATAYCFPSGVRYTVRGGNQWVLTNGVPAWLHDTIVDYANGNRCIRDCRPQKRWFRNRVFELATTDTCGPDHTSDACRATGVGAGTPNDGPCRYDPLVLDADGNPTSRGVSLNEPHGAAACIFENLTSRFAVYRGQSPSVRDMSFVWDQNGGFYPLTGSLAAQSTVVLPQHLAYVPEYEAIAVVDGATLGLSLMSIDTLLIQDPWPVF